VGKSAGSLVTTGSDNTFVGNQAGDTVTTGQQLTIIGGYSDASATIQNATAIGYNTNVTATNNIFLGNTSVSAIKGQVSFSTYSDERIKKDIKDTDLGLEFIKELKPRKYKRVAPKDYPEEFKDPNKDDLNNPDYIVDGLVAQEVKQTMDKLDVTFSGWDKDENTTKQSLEYPAFVPALIKAIQELSTQVDELKSELLALKGE
jgi:trimeric autotransporter adhesin